MHRSALPKIALPVLAGLTAALIAAFASADQQRGDPPSRVPPATVPPLSGGDKTAQLNQLNDVVKQAFSLYGKGQFTQALSSYEKALELSQRILGEDHRDTALCYNGIGVSLNKLGRQSEAEKAHAKALEIRRKVLGEMHADTASSYHNLAYSASKLKRFGEAEKYERKALEIRLKLIGETHISTASSFCELASFLHHQEKFQEAEILFRKGLEVRRKLLGEEHLETAATYYNLALNLHDLGKLTEAESLGRTALKIHRKVLGEDHPNTAASYSNLGSFLDDLGRFAEAEQLHLKSLRIRLKVFGENNLATANSYRNLANDLGHQKRFDEAEQLRRKVLEINSKLLGEDHPEMADSYYGLANVLSSQGRHEEAEHLYLKALRICVKVYGEEHAATAKCYVMLADVLQVTGKAEEAEKLLRMSVEILRNQLGNNHPSTSSSYTNLALFLVREGRYAEAEKLNLKTLDIRLKSLGEDHADTNNSYLDLAWTAYFQGDYEKAGDYAKTAAARFQKARLRVSLSGLGRSSFTASNSPATLLTALLARKGSFADAWKCREDYLGQGLLDDFVIGSNSSVMPKERQQLEMLQWQLAIIDKRLHADKKIDAKELDKLSNERNLLLAQMLPLQADLLAGLEKANGTAAGKAYDLGRIQASMSEDSAFIGWLDFPGQEKAKDPSGDHWGFVIRHTGPPVFVKLPGSGPDGLWAIKDKELPLKVKKLLREVDVQLDWKSWLNDLARQRLRPLQEHVEGVRHLIVLPSNVMMGIPIEALTDRFVVSYAPSATMYAWLRDNHKGFGAGEAKLLALADPVFSQAQAELPGTKQDALSRLLRGELKQLPGTRGEAKAIAKLFGANKATLFLGTQATGANIDKMAQANSLAQYRYLHLATHGFADSHAGLNSYLALTPEDLTEASHDKLSAAHMKHTWKLKADLVTLSACTTALGEHQGGEGFIGFSQALFLAGAQTVVVSQWPVHDYSTTLLMERFYQNLLGKREGLKGPLSKVEALDEARRWLKALKRDEAIKHLQSMDVPVEPSSITGTRPFEHPYYWAPFILVGDPGLPAVQPK